MYTSRASAIKRVRTYFEANWGPTGPESLYEAQEEIDKNGILRSVEANGWEGETMTVSWKEREEKP